MGGAPDAPDPFADGEPARELALVVLYAAALERRAFPAGPGADQLLLALALAPCIPADGLASMLALDGDGASALLEELHAARLVEPCDVPEEIASGEIPHDELTWTLTADGREAAVAAVERVARLLPSWPPEQRRSG
jgi:hypothetical protein